MYSNQALNVENIMQLENPKPTLMAKTGVLKTPILFLKYNVWPTLLAKTGVLKTPILFSK